MQTTGWRLGPHESRLLTWAQVRKVDCARTEKVAQALHLSGDQTTQLLSRMQKRGLIVQLQRGLYLLPRNLPPGGKWTPAPESILSHLMAVLGGDYQITGQAAFHFHGLTDQVPNVLAVYNNKLSERKTIGKLAFEFIKVSPQRLGGVEEQKSPSSESPRRIGSLARTLMDAVYDYSRFGSLPKAYEWIAQRKGDQSLLLQLAEASVKFGNVATIRRIGCLFNLLDAPKRAIELLREAAPKTESFIPLLPAQSRKGSTSTEWGVIINYSIPHR